MHEWWTVGLAGAALLGAARPAPLPLVAALLLVVGATALRRPLLLCIAVAVLTSTLGHRALAGLDDVPVGAVDGEVTLLTDPEPAPGGVRADARLGHRRVELRAGGAAASALEAALAGERVSVRGTLGPAPSDDWAVARHLAGRLQVHRAERVGTAGLPAAATNAVRRALVRGAASLPPEERSLYAGLVVGDDRAQPPALADSFRGAGLTHLLAVSGQNVAFVLALAGPTLRRLRLWPRLVTTVALIGLFVVLTRAEPSVVRAAAMAVVATATVTIGRPMSRLRVLGLATTGLVVVDPLLVRALGFRLSLAATAAIVVAAEPLARRLPGPRWLAEPLAVTLAAQVGVAPFLVGAFGPLPLASVPANLLVVPVAGAAMAWGLSAGLLAGLVPPGVATYLHLPTRCLLWWIEAVATRASAAPLGRLDGRALAVLVAGAAAALVARRHHRIRVAGALVAATVVAGAVLGAHAPPPVRRALAPGVVHWHGPGTEVVVLGDGGWRSSPSPAAVLEVLRTAGVGAIDLLVVADAAVAASTVDALRARHPPGAVVVPGSVDPADRPPGAVAAPAVGTTLRVGALVVLIVPAEGRLVVEAWPVAA